MGVVEVRKIFLVAALPFKDAVIDLLQTFGQVELKESADSVREAVLPASGEEKLLSRLENAISFLSRGQKRGLIDSLIGDISDVSENKFMQTVAGYQPRPVLDRVEELSDRLTKVQEKISLLAAAAADLKPWKNLDLKLNVLSSLENVSCVLLIVSRINYPKLAAALAKIDRTLLDEVSSNPAEHYALAIFSKTDRDQVEKIFSLLAATQVSLPEIERTPREELAALERTAVSEEAEKKSILTQITGLKNELLNLKIIYDHLFQVRVRQAAEKKLGRTAATFVLEGWVPRPALEDLRQKLSGLTDRFLLEEAPLLKIDTPPVVMTNNQAVRPYEIITRMFGAPTPGEIDPTPILAIFFFIYFGICLGDAGYGIILMLVAWWFMKKYRLPAGGLALMKVFLFGGLASVIAGALFGSWFGIDFQTVAVPLVIKNFLLKFKILDIFKSPIVMLYFSFVLGLIQIFTGLFIGLYNTLKARDYRAVLLDHISWICFLSGLVTWGLLKVAGLWSAAIFGWFTIFWTLFLIFTQGRHKPTWYEKIWSGILSLYKTTGYLGDVLSYSRLLALGMCSAVIAMVINILAGLVKSIPLVGWILMVVILIGGHLFNLIMSLLSAFIHSMRLQLVEFFGKFFAGGGRFFKPFQREAKYINIFKEV